MNMKKALAGFMAGIVAISAMATVAVSAKAQEAGTRTFDTYQYEYSVESTVTFKAAIDTANTPVTFALDAAALGVAADMSNVEIKSASIGGEKIAEDELDVYVAKVAAGKNIKVITTGVDAGKAVAVTVKIKAAKADKDAAKNAAKAINDADPKVNDADGKILGGAIATNIVADSAAGNVSAKAIADQYFLQIDGKVYDMADPTKAEVVDGLAPAAPGVGETFLIKDEKWATVGAGTTDPVLKKAKSADFGGDLNAEIANTLAGNRGAVLTFYFQDKREKEDDNLPGNPGYGQDTDWNDGEYTDDFAIRVNGSKVLSGVGKIDAKNMAISFDWDTVLAKSDLLNSVGQVGIEFKANEKGFLYDEDYDKDQQVATYAYEIVKIEVKWPAAEDGKVDMEEFAAGESATVVEDTLPAATDAPATTDAPAATTAATDGAANPETGNSAVALLAIPAALAAAAIVAKKRG